MATEKADNNALLNQLRGQDEKAVAKKAKTWSQLLEASSAQIGRALQNSMGVERFVRVCMTVVRGKPELEDMAKRNPISLIASCIEIAQAGLDPSISNEAHLIAYEGKTQAIRPLYGYKGLQKLAMRAAHNMGNPLVSFVAQEVYSKDRFEYFYGDTPRVIHQPPAFGQDRGEVVGYYAVAKDSQGKISLQVMSKAEAQKHKNRFCKSKYGPFADEANFDRYGVKTVTRLLISRELPMDATLNRAVATDIEAETLEDRPKEVEVDVDLTELSTTAAKQPEEKPKDDAAQWGDENT